MWTKIRNVILSSHVAWLIITLLFLEREKLKGQLHASLSYNEYGSRLAIVIPFIEEEYPIIETNFRLWEAHFPCSSNTADHVDLVFYYNQDLGLRPQLSKKLYKLVSNSPIRKCFNQIRFLMANLPPRSEEDRYPLGSSLMFFRAMELPLLIDNYRYMYWMEADQQPCRPGWLDQLYHVAINHPKFWMIGSTIRDGQQSNTYYSFADHINGNALYRLDDPKFHNFLSIVQEEFSKNKGRFLQAFDIAIYLVARHTLPFADYAAQKHHFQYTDILQNVYRTTTNVTQLCHANPSTFLVHGKYLSR
jgi:hypothetical protein